MIDIKHDDPLQEAMTIVNSLISPILIKLHCANVTNCPVPPVKAYLMNACSFMQSFREFRASAQAMDGNVHLLAGGVAVNNFPSSTLRIPNNLGGPENFHQILISRARRRADR